MHRAYRSVRSAPKPSSGVWKKILVGIVTVGATGTAGAWMLGYFSEDPALAEVRRIQQQLQDPNLNDENRRELFVSMRSKIEALPEDTRRMVWEAGREGWQRRDDERMRRILAMSPGDRTKALDEEIDREEQWRKRRSERQEAGGAPGGNAGANRPRGNLSDADRIARTKQRLDRSTSEQRSMRNQMRRLVEQRRKERGLPPGGGGPGRGRG